MQTIYFDLEPDQEYITLVNLLKYENIISSGGEIGLLIAEELITVNGVLEQRKRRKCYPEDQICVADQISVIINKK